MYVRMILTSYSQSVWKWIWRRPLLIISCIAHIRPSASAWRGVAALLFPLEPKSRGLSSSIRTKPRHVASWTPIQEESTLHLHLPGLGCCCSCCVSLGWSSPSTARISAIHWAARQLSASFVAICNDSCGVMSLLLKTFSFLTFHIYHMIHGNEFISSEFTPWDLALNIK